MPQQAPAPDPKKPDAKPVLNSVTMKVTAAPDAALGVREFRIATPRGVSSVGLLVIGDEPEVVEKEPNERAEQAQAVTLPVTINGKIQANEDVDVFKFTAAAGEQVTFSVLAARLEDKIHDLQNHIDPMLVLRDASGRELAVNDDYFRADPLLVYRFEQAGDYFVQVRDVSYQGNANWTYRLSMTRRPFVTALFPMAAAAGAPVDVTPVGFNLGELKRARLEVPAGPPGARTLQLAAPGGATNPVSLIVSNLPESLELEGNNEPGQANRIAVPSGVSGRIGVPGDRDCYRFQAVKDQLYIFEIEARRYDSALDSYLVLLDAAGKELVNNDDAVGKDSKIVDWKAPADGEYTLQVRDLHDRGGDNYVYHLTARPSLPDFTLQCDGDKAQMGPGAGTAWYVSVTRTGGFTGPVKLAVKGLPPGVTATCATIPATMTQGCILLSAAADAKVDATNVQVIGSGERPTQDGKTEPIERLTAVLEEIYTPGGGRGRFPVNMQTISITEPSDITLEVSDARVTLKPGASTKIGVKVKRSPGYTKPVTLDVRLQHLGQIFGNPLPPGVTLDEGASKTSIGDKETEGWITLKAAPDAAAIENIPIAVLGAVSINFVVKVSYAAPPVMLSVAGK
jgi:hypothetical protein